MKLQEILEKATPRPWGMERCPCGDPTCTKFVIVKPFNIDGRFSKEDALLLCHAVNSFELLLKAAKAMLPYVPSGDLLIKNKPEHAKTAQAFREAIRQAEEV